MTKNCKKFINRVVKTKDGTAGFTLIELFIAIFIMTTGIMSVYSLIPKAIESSIVNTDKYIAIQLAREGIEIVRNIRDTNWIEQLDSPVAVWDEGLTNCDLGCEVIYTMPSIQDPVLPVYGSGRYLRIDSNGFYGYTVSFGDKETKFKRKITITPAASSLKTVVQIIWSSDYQDVILEETFYDWK